MYQCEIEESGSDHVAALCLLLVTSTGNMYSQNTVLFTALYIC